MAHNYVDSRVVDTMRVYSNPSSTLNSARYHKSQKVSLTDNKSYSVRTSSVRPIVSTKCTRNPTKVYVSRRKLRKIHQNIPGARLKSSRTTRLCFLLRTLDKISIPTDENTDAGLTKQSTSESFFSLSSNCIRFFFMAWSSKFRIHPNICIYALVF